ncbi:MAG: hypothetical protein K2K51_02765 [Bacteroidales bacterium]|nr:hypothetical protein [Bacteroidales bacterium]
MPAFFDDISRYGSVAVVGTAKNVGKTFCLQHILTHYRTRAQALAVTSIGVDGENTDVFYKTPKPELTFYPGMLVQTSETHYRQRHLTADILHLSRTSTALGRLVTARVQVPGKLILSGPSDTGGLRDFIAYAHAAGHPTALIDGALSRMSLASSAVAQAMILCTGAALSKSLDKVVQDAVFRHELMQIPLVEPGDLPVSAAVTAAALDGIRQGVWGLSEAGGLIDLGLRSTLAGRLPEALTATPAAVAPAPDTLFVAGMLSDRFLQALCGCKKPVRLIVSDFTKIFVQPVTYRQFLKKGGTLRVLHRTELLAVCANPCAPEGYAFDSARLCDALSTALNREVYDVARG